jgi:hypothetical protein
MLPLAANYDSIVRLGTHAPVVAIAGGGLA